MPRGPVWQHLRQLALTSVPAGSATAASSAAPLNDWLTRGYFSISQASNTGFVLEATSSELGSAILSDVSFQLDHAAEQRSELLSARQAAGWRSSAWALVCTYYWAYFAGNGLARLLGDFTVFLDTTAIAKLVDLAPAPPGKVPGMGTYRFKLQDTAGQRRVAITRVKGRLHESFWRTLFGVMNQALTDHGDDESNLSEFELFTALSRSVATYTPDWPSAVRNRANYAPGAAYGAVRALDTTKLIPIIRRLPARTPQSLFEEFANAVQRSRRLDSLLGDLPVAASLLLALSSVLDVYSNELIAEVLSRGAMDGRWHERRLQLNRRLNQTPENWPHA